MEGPAVYIDTVVIIIIRIIQYRVGTTGEFINEKISKVNRTILYKLRCALENIFLKF